jgi:hypothetical protein
MSYRIVAKPCTECPWKGRFPLAPGRLKDLMEVTRADDAVFVCHMTQSEADAVGLPGDDDDEDGGEGRYVYPVAGPGRAAVCAGWIEAMRSQDWRPAALQIAERLDANPALPAMIERVPPPETSLRDA